MKYRSYAIVKNDNGIEIDEPFTDVIDRKGYLVIDKEELARRIIDENDVSDFDECDIMALVEDELHELGALEITDMILEMRYE